MKNATKYFNFVDFRRDEKLGDNQVALFLYCSNILGADLRITNYAGSNKSCGKHQ
jgi:rhamnose utilization protein RhaD (predicted bifunctional aldolase and dehydrogenase)